MGEECTVPIVMVEIMKEVDERQLNPRGRLKVGDDMIDPRVSERASE